MKPMLPLVVEPAANDLSLPDWLAVHREDLERDLQEHGGVLFRGFDVGGVDGFQPILSALSEEQMGYRDRATPRSQVGDNVFTATDLPPQHTIFLHNESSFAHTWPLRIFFYCVQPAEEGGETPLADVREIYRRVDPEIRERFEDKGVMYVRNFTAGPFGLPWQSVFQTDDRDEMEEYCRASDIEFEWRDGDRLRTWQTRPATAKHPRTGEWLWFNHAVTLNVSTLEPRVRKTLRSFFSEEELPNNTYYGDGSPIEPAVLESVRSLYEEQEVTFTWKRGDLLMLDNMLVAHGRRPFKGRREVVVGMSEPQTRRS